MLYILPFNHATVEFFITIVTDIVVNRAGIVGAIDIVVSHTTSWTTASQLQSEYASLSVVYALVVVAR